MCLEPDPPPHTQQHFGLIVRSYAVGCHFTHEVGRQRESLFFATTTRVLPRSRSKRNVLSPPTLINPPVLPWWRKKTRRWSAFKNSDRCVLVMVVTHTPSTGTEKKTSLIVCNVLCKEKRAKIQAFLELNEPAFIHHKPFLRIAHFWMSIRHPKRGGGGGGSK